MGEELTRAELIALVTAQQQTITELRAEIDVLKAQLAASSRNSSTPPSADGLGKPAPRSLRGKSGRKPGGQDGHPGRTLRQVEVPDEIVRHEPGVCTGCGRDASRGEQVGVERRQVFDLPPTEVHVTEHQLITRRCGCGQRATGAAPQQVAAPVQYGPRITAAVVYLYVGQFLSKARTAQAISDLLGVPVSEGTVAAACARAGTDLVGTGGFTDTVRAQLRGSELVHFDETGLRVAGKLHWLHWLHSAGNSLLTLLFVHRRRGREAIDAAGVLPGYAGIAVHDAWAPYDTYTAARHVLCGAHLLRELQAVADHHSAGAVASPIDGWCWAVQVADNLLALKTHTAHAWASGTRPDPAVITARTKTILDAATIAAADHTNHGPLAAKHRALARRLGGRLPDYLAFTTDPHIPFDNNLAEVRHEVARDEWTIRREGRLMLMLSAG